MAATQKQNDRQKTNNFPTTIIVVCNGHNKDKFIDRDNFFAHQSCFLSFQRKLDVRFFG